MRTFKGKRKHLLVAAIGAIGLFLLASCSARPGDNVIDAEQAQDLDGRCVATGIFVDVVVDLCTEPGSQLTTEATLIDTFTSAQSGPEGGNSLNCAMTGYFCEEFSPGETLQVVCYNDDPDSSYPPFIGFIMPTNMEYDADAVDYVTVGVDESSGERFVAIGFMESSYFNNPEDVMTNLDKEFENLGADFMPERSCHDPRILVDIDDSENALSAMAE